MTKEVPLRLLLAAIGVTALLSVAGDARPASAAADIRLVSSDPENPIAVNCAPEGHEPGAFDIVRIENHGDSPQDLTGWKLKSDPEGSEQFSLDVAGTLVPLVNVKDDRVYVTAGQHATAYPDRKTYVWSIGGVLRDSGDPPDYVRLYDPAGNLVDSKDCNQNPVPLPTVAPTPTPAPQAAVVIDQTANSTQPQNQNTTVGGAQGGSAAGAQGSTSSQNAAAAPVGGASSSVPGPNSGIGSLAPVRTAPSPMALAALAAGLAGLATSAVLIRRGLRRR